MSLDLAIAYVKGQDIAPYIGCLDRFCDKSGAKMWIYDEPSFATHGEAGLCHVRLGEGNTPLLAGEAKVLVALEELEGRRALRYLAKDGILVLCRFHRLPLSVATGTVGYPSDTLDILAGRPLFCVQPKEFSPLLVCALTLRAMGVRESDVRGILANDSSDAIGRAFGKSLGV